MLNYHEKVGSHYGRLVLISFAGYTNGLPMYWCDCSCGNRRRIAWRSLYSGKTQSCGCLRKERLNARRKHSGDVKSLLSCYTAAKQRCTNQNNPYYKNYGGRGIEFRFNAPQELLDAIGLRPSLYHSLDRIDNDGHYERGNVRWATREEQRHNRIRAKDLSAWMQFALLCDKAVEPATLKSLQELCEKILSEKASVSTLKSVV